MSDVSGELGLTRFLGRQKELALLHHCFEECKAGRGQVVSIVGEAGIGKSRLLHEFRKTLANEDVTYLEGNCHPHGKQTPYYPLIDILRSYFHIESGDKDSEIRDKVRNALSISGIEEGPCLPYLFELLSMENSGIEEILPSYQNAKAGIIETLRLIVLKASSLRPVVLAVEDWHWSDKTSEEASVHLSRAIEPAQVLLIFSYRPLLDNWGIWPRHTQLVLNSLSDQDTLAMTADLLGAKKLDRDLRELVLRNTRGVPFFVEEFMGFLNNLKIIDKKGGKCHLVRDVREMTVPCTIQDLIISRINSLPASATEVLLAGSVAGRQFDYQLIARITALPDYELMSRLSILRYSGFLYERGVCPQSTYVFKHALIQDASYRLLSEEDRRSYHLKIAEELEQHSPEVIREDPGKLGHHLAEGGLREQAVQYWQKAADIAIRRSANHEAIHHLRTALETVKTLPETPERTRRELELQIALGPALMAIKGYAAPEVKSVYSRARNLCERLDETPQLYTILRGLWGFFIVRSELEAAHRLGERCLAIARRTKKPPLVLWAHYALGMTLFHMGEFARALEHLEKGVELYDVRKRQSQRALQDPGVACFSYRALALWMLGYPDQALKTSRKAVALADSLSHPFSRAYALSLGAMVNQFCGRVQEVREQAEVSEALCTKHGISYWFAWGPILQGWTLIAQGQGDEGIKQILLGLAAYSATGAEIARPLFLVILADAYRREGKVTEGLACVTEGLDRAHNTWDRFCEPELHRLKGELILAMSPHDRTEAEACFRKALDISRQRKAKSFELRAATSLSRLLQGCGKDLEARELLAEAYGWFTEGLDSRDLKDARAMLDRMV